MPIHGSNAPPGAISAVIDAMQARAKDSWFATDRLARNAGKNLVLSVPHRLAYLPFENISPGDDLRGRVVLAGWRFLIHDGDEAIAAATTIASDATGSSGNDQAWTLRDIAEGAFVGGMEDAIIHAEELPNVDR